MKQRYRKAIVLIPLGLLFNGLVFFLSRIIQMPDFLRGTLMGFGIGLMMVGLMASKAKPSKY